MLAQQSDPQNDAIDKTFAQPKLANSAAIKATRDAGIEAVPTAVEQRELGVDENPMAVSEAQRDARRENEATVASERATGFDIYASLRIRYREQDGETGLQDGNSRMGVESDWQFAPGSYLFGRYELGFNLLTGINPDRRIGELEGTKLGDTIFTRLLYAGLDVQNVHLIVGKNWSPYYDVASFTDRFEGAGGVGSGAFNALTDGGPTGTGRADKAVQSKLPLNFLPHIVFKPFELNLQLQHGNSIPFGDGADYGTAFGVSAVMTTQANFTVGLAYNHASIDLDNDPSLRDIGIAGSARAMLVGTRAFGERWYAGFTYAKHENHETTGTGIYFDGWGSEFYGQYRMTDRVWFVGGYNILEPDSDQPQAGDFRVRYAVLGLRYSIEDFRRMIWANVRINDGLNADGTPRSNIYSIGVRWDISKRGWHLSN